QGTLRDPRHARAEHDREDGVARLHPAHQLGRRRAGEDGLAGRGGGAAGLSAGGRAAPFYAGFCLGALALYVVLVWSGALRSPVAAPTPSPPAAAAAPPVTV